MKKLKESLVVALLHLFALLPWCLVQKTGAFIGWVMWLVPNRSRQVAHINLSKCFPDLCPSDLNQLTKQTLINQGKTLVEGACAWIWPAQKSIALIKEVEGLEILQAALKSGKGVVGITSHLGNWEILNHFFCSQCNPIIFYRPPKLDAVHELVKKQRIQMGNRVAPSTKEGILSIIKEVRQGGAVGIPADPEPSRSAGIFVPFFATQVLTSKFVPSMITGKKALGFFLHAIRLPKGQGFKVIIQAAPEEMYDKDMNIAVTAMSKVVESYVSQWTTQYVWSMKRFKNRPDGETRWY